MEKRLFFGLEVVAPWPETFPKGRVLHEESRHITLAFLGAVDYDRLEERLTEMPKPTWKVGQVGFFEKCIFLARVVAWDPVILGNDLITYQKALADWLKIEEGREFLCHMTIARGPFDHDGWKKSFTPLPFYTRHLHLYESLGNSTYNPLWTHEIHPPFEEIEHVADIAFRIYGESIEQIYIHAQFALAFKSPEIKNYLRLTEKKSNVSEIVMALNEIITQLDQEIGSPFKAVSFHGEIQKKKGILTWEMIVDV